jgi:SAM-dependent methyltransferase
VTSHRGPAHWDERYADAARPWTREPSPTVTGALADLSPGRAVDVACGTGRHGLWLAERGWQVTAVDSSAVGVAQGRAEAEARRLPVDWVVADARDWSPAFPADLVLAAHVQLGVDGFQRCARWLAPGGRLVVVGHALRNLTEGPHGPRDPALLHTPEALTKAAAGLAVERLEEVTRPDDGGTVAEVVLVARRPT